MSSTTHVTTSASERRAMRLIAMFEGLKGCAAILVTFGLLTLLHHDIRHLAIALIGHFGLNPDSRYSSIFLHYADILNDENRRTIALIAVAYITLRFAEAYGLWHNRIWATWLGAIAGGIYIPVEILHFWHHLNLINAAVLLGNLLVVAYLVRQIWVEHQRRQAQSAADV